MLESIVTGLVCLILALNADAGQTPVEKGAPIDVRAVLNEGADLYNSGDQNGCCRLFERTLNGLRLALKDRPDLVKVIDAGLEEASPWKSLGENVGVQQGPGVRAFRMRETLRKVQNLIRMGCTVPSLEPTSQTKD